MSGVEVRRLGYALGARVTGIDLSRPPTPQTVAAVREAILEHLVLCFPAQDVDQRALMNFAQSLGEIEPASKENVDPDVPQVSLLTNKAIDGKSWSGYQAGSNWHSDHSYTTQPTSYSILASKEIPPVGGDTMFANTYMSYDALSPAMQRLIAPLEGIHPRALPTSFRTAANVEKQNALAERDAKVTAERLPVAHPVVRPHPETGRKTLYVGARITRFVGMTEEESKPLIDFLNDHAVRYEFTYRHRWTLGDVVMWDNRSTLHIAISDYDMNRDTRKMLRCSVKGERSGYELTPEAEAGARALETV